MASVDGTDFSHHTTSATRTMTKIMILHPIACGLNFIAFLLALGAGVVGSFLASLVALLAFVTTVVVMIIDFVLFGIIKHKVNDDGSGSHAHFSVAIWLILVSAICSLLGTVVVFFTCCSARIHNRRHSTKPAETSAYGAPVRRRRWF